MPANSSALDVATAPSASAARSKRFMPVVRWTAPSGGNYKILAKWSDLNPTDNGGAAHVVINGQQVFGRQAENGAFIGQEWPDEGPAAMMPTQTFALAAGDVVDFVLSTRAGDTNTDGHRLLCGDREHPFRVHRRAFRGRGWRGRASRRGRAPQVPDRFRSSSSSTGKGRRCRRTQPGRMSSRSEEWTPAPITSQRSRQTITLWKRFPIC